MKVKSLKMQGAALLALLVVLVGVATLVATPQARAGEKSPLAAVQQKVVAAVQSKGAGAVLAAQAATESDHASVSLVQELTGRQWVKANGKASLSGAATKLSGGDSFTFKLVPVGKAEYRDGGLVTKDGADDGKGGHYQVIDRASGIDSSAATLEAMPQAAPLTITAASARVSDSQRFGAFGDLAVNQADFTLVNGVSRVDYFYDLVQVIPDEAVGTPVGGQGGATVVYSQVKDQNGFNAAAYTWVHKGVAYSGETHEVHVSFVDSGGESRTLPHVSYDGRPYGSYVPVFANDYDASGRSWAHVVTHLDGRDFAESDRFSYGITNVGGSIMRPTDGTQGDVSLVTMTHITHPMQLPGAGSPGYGYHFAANQRINQDVDGGEMAILTGEGTFHSFDLNEDGEGLFVYAIAQFEEVTTAQNAGFTVQKVEDLEYDGRTVYLRYHVTDNADGTLQVETHYYANAACTEPLTVNGKIPQIKVDAETGEPVSPDATTDFITMDAAYFRNICTVDVPVRKVWAGTPVDDVTVHLERALFDGGLTDLQIEALAENGAADGKWERIGLTTTLPRADFLKADGTPLNNAGVGKSSVTYGGASQPDTLRKPAIEGFNKGLPMYVIEDGKTMRAAYRLTEDDTSDAYEPNYYSVDGITVKQGDQIFVDSGTQVVENEVVAMNSANIAAVSQLMGRTWLATDSFGYELEPLGKAIYDENGVMQTERSGGKTVAKLAAGSAQAIPMPAAAHASGPSDVAANAACATVATSQVAVGEHLARFGSIAFDTSQLVHDPQDQHLQGDFYYRLRAAIPADAMNAAGERYDAATDAQRAAGGFAKAGVTYDAKESIVHVRVRENRTKNLQVSVAYDETDQSDTSTGTQFTPVFTNYYDVEQAENVDVQAHVMGRGWQATDALDFTLRAMSGAAFVPWAPEDQVRLDHDGLAPDAQGAMQNEDYWLAAGRQVVSRDGALKMRVVPGAAQGMQAALAGQFAQMKFTLDDLHYEVGEGGAKDERDAAGVDGAIVNAGGTAAAGLRYGRFMYAVNQSAVHAEDGDLLRDADTEYAQILVVDNGDGTFATSVTIFEDRYGTVPRFAPDLNSSDKTSKTPARAVTFVNQATRSIAVEKRWVGVVDADVVVKLQKTTAANPAEADWADDRDAGTLVFAADDMPEATDAVATASFDDLPVFQKDGNDLDLDDPELKYRVVEATDGTGKFEASYGTGGSAAPVVAKAGEVQVVTNRSTYTSKGSAHVSVVVELAGRSWLSADPDAASYSPNVPEGDVFELDLQPLGKGAYDADGNLALTDGKVNDDTLVAGSAARVPMPVTPAFAVTDGDAEHHVSDSQRLADFGSVDLALSDMTRLPDGRMVGDFFYRIVQTPSADARAWKTSDGAGASKYQPVAGASGQLVYRDATPAQRDELLWEFKGVLYDKTAHELRIHVEDNGTGTFVPEVSYDGNPVGHTAPVFANTYDAEGSNAAHVTAHIEGRSWNEGDRFEFRVTAVGGAAFDPNGGQAGAGSTEAAVWTTGVMNGGGRTESGLPLTATLENGDKAMVTGRGTFHLADLTPGTGGNPASGQFVYQVQEIDPSNPATFKNANPTVADKVADLDYDENIVYLRISVWDNLDGTLSTRNEYFRDAACLEPLADADGKPYLVWVNADEDVVAPGTAGAVQVPAAYFANELAASGEAQVVAVDQLVGRVWLAGERHEVQLAPLGKARYDASGAVQTEPGTFGGKLVALPALVSGSAAAVPMPCAGVQGTGAARVAVAQASADTLDAGEGGHLATFAGITFSLGGAGGLEYNAAEECLAGDFYYRLSEKVPDDALNAAGVAYADADDATRLAGGFTKAGITYDAAEHLVHVAVRETGPNMIGCFVYYDEADAADTATGNQFAPVFTNRYSATGTRAVAVSTTLAGRDWSFDDVFDFELRAMGGAPFVYGSQVVVLDQNGYAAGRFRDDYLDEGRAVATRLGALRFRMKPDRVESGSVPLEGIFPELTFNLESLAWRVGAGGEADEADRYGDRVITYSPDDLQYEGESDDVVPEGLAYGKFTYAVNQLEGADASVIYDTATEYAQVLVIDKGDGTLDVSVHIYDDRYGTQPRYDAGNALPVTAAQFANTAASDDFSRITAKVSWLDAGGTEAHAPEGARVQLTLTGRDGDALSRVEQADADAAGSWEASWYAPAGLAFDVAASAPDGYVATVDPANAGGGDGEAVAFDVVVRPVAAALGDVVGIGVSAAWDDDSNRDGRRVPFALEVQSRQAGTEGEWSKADGAQVEADGEASSQPQAFTFDGLPATQESQALEYRVVIAEADARALREAGYSVVVSRTDDWAFEVRCARSPEAAAIRAAIGWLDLDDALSTRPSSARLMLLADGDTYGTEQTVGPAQGGWSHIWYNVPVRAQDGHEISYEVVAVGLSGYDAPAQKVVMTGGLARVDVVARSLAATKQVNVQVSWQDASGSYFTPSTARPVPSVTLQLVCNSGATAAIVEGADRVLAANANGQASWTGLAAYDEQGRELFYTVTQKGLSGYTPLYAAEPEAAGTSNVMVVNRASDAAAASVAAASPKLDSNTVVILKNATGLVYNGKAKRPAVRMVVVGDRVLLPSAYTVSYANNVKPGKATVTVTGKGQATGKATATFTIAKAANKMKAKARAVKLSAKKLKKKAQVVKRAKAFKITGAAGKLVFKKAGGSAKLKVSRAGKITVKKKTKKGLYKLKVKITAKGNGNYKAKTKTVTVKVRVR